MVQNRYSYIKYKMVWCPEIEAQFVYMWMIPVSKVQTFTYILTVNFVQDMPGWSTQNLQTFIQGWALLLIRTPMLRPTWNRSKLSRSGNITFHMSMSVCKPGWSSRMISRPGKKNLSRGSPRSTRGNTIGLKNWTLISSIGPWECCGRINPTPAWGISGVVKILRNN